MAKRAPKKIDWREDEILELAALCSRQSELASLLSEKWKKNISPSTFAAYLHRNPSVRSRVQGALSDTEEEVVSTADILKEENRELRLALNRQRRESVGEERVLQAIELAMSQVPKVTRRKPNPLPKREPGAPHHRQMVLLSDFHAGEVVDSEVVSGLNTYDWQIMEERVGEVIDSLLSHQRRSPDLTGLDIAFLGDMCSGENHLELAVSNDLPLAEQGVRMGLLMGQIVERLAPHYPDVKVISVEGNHPRLTKAPQAKNPQNNMDWVAAQFAKQYVADLENVTFTVGRGSLIHTIAGLRVFAFHGDGIRSSMPGIPWGGVMRRVNQLQASLPEHIDHWVFGHFHQANLVNAGRVIGNGSLKGVDEWCRKNLGAGDPPAQWLLTFDEKRSRMTDARLLTPTAGLGG